MTKRATAAGTTAYPDLSADQKTALRAAAGLYAKHLEGLAESATALGKDREGAGYAAEAARVKDDLLAKFDADVPALLPAERKAIEKGLAFFVKNLRAAKGTVRGLGKTDLADSFEIEAVAIETELVPQFGEQISLKV